MLDQVKIGLIGYGAKQNRGHLGKALHRRLAAHNINIEHSAGNTPEEQAHLNAKLASRVDLLLVTVTPFAIHQVIQQIRGHLRRGSQLLSFAAACPETQMENVGVPVARAMTDIEGFGGMLHGGDELTREFMTHVSHFPTIIADHESQIDCYTIGEACLPGVAAWHLEKNRHTGQRWLAEYVEFLKQKGLDERVTRSIINSVESKGNWAEKLGEVATGGGITAAMVNQLDEGGRDHSIIYAAGEARMQELIKKLTQK